MNCSSQLIELFRKYGFEYKKSASGKGYYAFTFKTGFFHNAEFVYTDEADLSSLALSEKGLDKIGFSIKRSKFEGIEKVERDLFNGFFNVEQWKERIVAEYIEYSNKMLSLLPEGAENYSYVDVPYEKKESKGLRGIINDLVDEVSGSGAKLLLIEAPAGFGKTCTSYEVINKLCELDEKPIPFFTEFSRDRQAKVFSHVFVREVDRSFTSVRSELVIEETKNGKIILVLDGFDELLNETSSSTPGEVDFEKAQPMLETIGELLTGEAKVILTSRRSAMFDGEIFQEWKERYNDRFEVIRYRLNNPEVEHWLSADRIELLRNSDIDIKQLSNPVLLAYLRSIDISRLTNLCNESSKIVEQYFISMLEREQERQELLMDPYMQSKVLTLVAEDMCEKDYTSDSKDQLIELIKEKAGGILEFTRKQYPSKDRPTLDGLANKLATHAFFDRSNQGENRIEFVNEFVFGNYIADSVLNHENNDWLAADERFVEPAVRSYIPRSKEDKIRLWEKLEEMKIFLSATDRFKYEYFLTDCVNENSYNNETISNVDIEDAILFESSGINNAVFNECSFKNINFNFANFSDVTFISCNFYSCIYDESNRPYDISFLNCFDDDSGFISSIEEYEEDIQATNVDEELEREILTKFMPVGSTSITRLHAYTGMLYKIDGYARKDITKAIKRLKDKGILESANKSSFTAINRTKVSDVKKILGRDVNGI